MLTTLHTLCHICKLTAQQFDKRGNVAHGSKNLRDNLRNVKSVFKLIKVHILIGDGDRQSREENPEERPDTAGRNGDIGNLKLNLCKKKKKF